MPFTSVAAGAPSVFVGSSFELLQAYATLSTTNGGGTIYMTNDFPSNGEINLTGGGSNPVHITSANPNDSVQISRIAFDDVDNVRVANVHVDSTGVARPNFFQDIELQNSSRIEIADSTFTSNGSIIFDPTDPNAVLGERLAMIRESQDVTISNNYISGYEQGLNFQESSQIRVIGNEITAMQGDGIRLVGVQDVLIEDNYLHDFSATPNEFTHSDFIQMWSHGTDTVSRDVTITGNVLDTGNGVAVQAIFLRNIAYEQGDTSHVYENFTITDNLIYTGAANGIAVGQADGVTIANNTLLWNPDAVTVKATGDTSWSPRIVLEDGITNAQVIDNITTRISAGDSAQLEGNILMSWDPASPNYVGNHFVNVIGGGDIGPEGWQLLEGSSWVGTGAGTSQPDGATPQPAQQPAPEPEPQPQPEPEPQPQPEPEPQPQPEPVPETSTPAQDATTLFAADFEGGVSDLSGYDSAIRLGSEANIVGTLDGRGYEIGDGKILNLHVDNEQIHNLTSFGFEMEITLLGSDNTGRFLHFPRAFEARINADGTVVFELTTDEGVFQVDSGDVTMNDGQPHMFAVGYDDAAGRMSMSIDGQVVGVADATGQTGEGVHHGLTIGSIWGNGVDAVVDDVLLSTDPSEAGIDLSLEVGERFVETPGGSGPQVGPLPAPEPLPEPELDDFFTTLFAMNFESGLQDGSGYDSSLRTGSEDNIAATEDGHAYRIGDGAMLRLDSDNAQIHELDSFALSLDIQLLEDDDDGRFLHFPRVFEARIEEDGSATFRLTTDDGTFRVNNGAAHFDDLQSHNFAVAYDSVGERLTMAIDGNVVDSVAASGQTGAMSHHGLTVGSIWGEDVMAMVDNIWFGEPQEGGDVSTDAGLIHSLNSTAVTPDPGEVAPFDAADDASTAAETKYDDMIFL